MYLMSSMQLAGQILKAAEEGFTYLSLVGSRCLLEKDVDSRYIFISHSNRAQEIADDYINRSNNLELRKNFLDNKSFNTRLKETDYNHSETYKNYSILTNYTHGLASIINLNKEAIFLEKTVHSFMFVLSSFHNIVENVSKFLEINTEVKEEEIAEFINKYSFEVKVNPVLI